MSQRGNRRSELCRNIGGKESFTLSLVQHLDLSQCSYVVVESQLIGPSWTLFVSLRPVSVDSRGRKIILCVVLNTVSHHITLKRFLSL